MAARLGPRLVVAGTHSGVGKTTVATGLMAALRRCGYRPAGAKVGPDFIDPGYHSLASGRPPRNLDAWLCGPDAIAPLAGRAAAGSGVLVVEGVMGLFDGAVDGQPSSTADVAVLIGAPVLLVVDASAMSTSVAALVHGYSSFDPRIQVAGVVLNRVGSPAHEVLLREALSGSGIPVVGALPHDDALAWRDRHLGLVPVAESASEVSRALERLADVVLRNLDLGMVIRIARGGVTRVVDGVALPPRGPKLRVGVAAGKAFTFTYTDTLDALESAGCDIARFDPLVDEHLPPGLDGLLIGGGFPEVYASELSSNVSLLVELREAITSGLPTWAECGGLLLLAQDLDGRKLAGVLPARATMTSQLTLGYRMATAREAGLLGPVGTQLSGHEFHYSRLDPRGDALDLASRWGVQKEGWGTPSMLATYLHHHPGGDPAAIAAFARQCTLRSALRSG